MAVQESFRPPTPFLFFNMGYFSRPCINYKLRKIDFFIILRDSGIIHLHYFEMTEQLKVLNYLPTFLILKIGGERRKNRNFKE